MISTTVTICTSTEYVNIHDFPKIGAPSKFPEVVNGIRLQKYTSVIKIPASNFRRRLSLEMTYHAAILLCVVEVFILGQCECRLTRGQMKYILHKHLTVRKNVVPPASNMATLEWNPKLADEAQNYADTCYTRRETSYSLNWATIFTGSPEEAVDKWVAGKDQYSYSSTELCRNTCDYIKMIWAKTQSLGCGAKVCDRMEESGKSPWFVVCFYFPGGNIYGERPYETTSFSGYQ